MIKFLSAVLMLSLTATSALGVAVKSWNLSRDLMTAFSAEGVGDNGVWLPLYDTRGVSHDPSNYAPLDVFRTQYDGHPLDALEGSEGWLVLALPKARFSIPGSSISIAAGVPILHPGQTNAAIVGWRSSINGVINISGSISDANSNCGDGVVWYIDKESTTIATGSFGNGSRGQRILAKNIPVSVGVKIFFVVAPKENNGCDQTALDIIISGS